MLLKMQRRMKAQLNFSKSITGDLNMSKTALVVDDSTSMRQMVTFTLQSAGFETIEGANGVEALAKSESKQVDIVITDLNMPEMDGITLIKQLRAKPAFQ